MDWIGFWQMHHAALWAYAVSLVRSEPAAEDLVQEMLLAAMKSGREPKDPLAYAMRALRNRAWDGVRRARAAGRLAERLVGSGEYEPTVRGDELERARVREAVETLPPLQREAVVLRLWCGLTHAQAAEVMEVPPGTAASHYARAIEALRRTLEAKSGATTEVEGER